MVKYRCGICKREFSTTSGLTQHANAKHHGRTSLSRTNEVSQIQQISQQSRVVMRPEHDTNLWSMPITMLQETISTNSSTLKNSTSQVDGNSDSDDMMEDVIVGEGGDNTMADVVSEPRYNLRNQNRILKLEENIEENVEDSDQESIKETETELRSPINLENDIFDLENLQGATLDDALETIEGKNKSENIADWPNNVYRDFMELIVEGNISKIGRAHV